MRATRHQRFMYVLAHATVRLVVMLALAVAIVIMMTHAHGCNSIPKSLGATQTFTMPAGKRIVNASWKEDDMWVLLEDRAASDPARSLEYKEFSNLGILQGTVVLKEQ